MSDDVLKVIVDLVLPPSGPIILLALGIFLWLLRLPILAAVIILFTTVVLYFSSTPFVAQKLLDSLQYQFPVLKAVPNETQAIVILGAGRLPKAREYDNFDIVNGKSLERLRYASRLAKVYKLPILIAGGSPSGEKNLKQYLCNMCLKEISVNKPSG